MGDKTVWVKLMNQLCPDSQLEYEFDFNNFSNRPDLELVLEVLKGKNKFFRRMFV